MTVVLSFHAKPQPERLPSGAGRPPLCRPAWGSRHMATDLQTVALIFSWRRLVVALVPRLPVLGRPAWGRPAGLPLAHLGLMFCRGFTLLLYVLQGSGLLKYFWSWAVLWVF